jgi:NAD(P)-dependent dehydrogenase (short-subunit alcohol dehydrogenase family)
MVDRCVSTFGRLDMAFNNAGIQVPPSDTADEPASTFDRVTAINLRGVWACMKQELRQMRERPVMLAAARGPPQSGSGTCDPDAISVGDYHMPDTVAWALAGEPRADDARMLELLEPYLGQRGRVQRLLEVGRVTAPRYGPRMAPRSIAAL